MQRVLRLLGINSYVVTIDLHLLSFEEKPKNEAKTRQIRFDKSPNSDIGNSELVVVRSSDGATPNHTLCNSLRFHTNGGRIATGNIRILRVERDIRLNADDEGPAVVVLGDTLDTHVQIARSLRLEEVCSGTSSQNCSSWSL